MASHRRRATALLSGCTILLSLLAAAPASAAGTTCQTLLEGPTPTVNVDADGDGHPDLRIPPVTDVRVCVQADVVLDDQPDVRSERCEEWGTCWRFFVDYHLKGYVQTGVQVCYTADGVPNCTLGPPLRVPLDRWRGGTMCVGVDLAGGRPCGGDSIVSFE
ncbi:MAG TPA: hypothetical protein VHN37_11255 [Actinomycetota bacterium]|nr:hypothetical protein [Actinomycetota bacterium]